MWVFGSISSVGAAQMGHTYSDLITHFVFSTKERRPMLTPVLQPKIFAYMAGVIENLEGKALLINGVPDHVHILARVSPKIAPAEFVKKLKSFSSGWVNDELG